ncbi:hypothetical protein ACFV4K_31435 [Nocardia sp. NPDC059764]|uniref:hypothetical protein n=1 Tax=Nocardia sp. NPDC059764 TaxID=3346939 RepID=UPI003665085E
MSELRGGVGDFDYPTPDPRPVGHAELLHPKSAFMSGARSDAGRSLEPVATTGCVFKDVVADPLVATG